MVGKEGLEPSMFRVSRVYSPLQSPLCTLAHMLNEIECLRCVASRPLLEWHQDHCDAQDFMGDVIELMLSHTS